MLYHCIKSIPPAMPAGDKPDGQENASYTNRYVILKHATDLNLWEVLN